MTMTLIFIILHAQDFNWDLLLVRLFHSGGIKFSDLSADEGKIFNKNVHWFEEISS